MFVAFYLCSNMLLLHDCCLNWKETWIHSCVAPQTSWPLTSEPPPEAMMLNDPRLCYILDVFLGLYGLVITGMLIREKVGLFKRLHSFTRSACCSIYWSPLLFWHKLISQFFRSQKTQDENIYSVSEKHKNPWQWRLFKVKRSAFENLFI